MQIILSLNHLSTSCFHHNIFRVCLASTVVRLAIGNKAHFLNNCSHKFHYEEKCNACASWDRFTVFTANSESARSVFRMCVCMCVCVFGCVLAKTDYKKTSDYYEVR